MEWQDGERTEAGWTGNGEWCSGKEAEQGAEDSEQEKGTNKEGCEKETKQAR